MQESVCTTSIDGNKDLYEELSNALKQETILSAAAHDDAPFEQVLQNWKDGKYPQNPAASTAFVIFSDPLSSAYEGLKGLKGTDSQMVNHVLPIAKKLGFTVFLSTIKKTAQGIPHEDSWIYPFIPARKRALHGDDMDCMELNDDYYLRHPQRWADDLEAYKTGNFDVELFDMGAIEKEVYELGAMRDITSGDGNTSFKGQTGIVVDKKAIIPKNAIEAGEVARSFFDRRRGELTHVYSEHACLILVKNEKGPTKKGKASAGKRKAASKTPSEPVASSSNPAALVAEVEGSRPSKRSRVD